jgi:hypothetical protein
VPGVGYVMRVIVSKFNGRSSVSSDQAQNRVRTAAGQLYDAECAWHDAHQTRVDAWIQAASEKLHDAIAAHLAAVAASGGSSGSSPTEQDS